MLRARDAFFNTSDWSLRHELPADPLLAVGFSDDPARHLTVGTDRFVKAWERRYGEELHAGAHRDGYASADGRHLGGPPLRSTLSAALAMLRCMPPNMTPWNGVMLSQYNCPANPWG